MGHAESAAGIAGVCKVLLQIQHKKLVPGLHTESPSEDIEFSGTPFYLQSELSEWCVRNGEPKRALINSFGAGGVNACVVLEEWNGGENSCEQDHFQDSLFVLSARTSSQLVQKASELADYLIENNSINLSDLAYTLQVGRVGMPIRLAIISRDTNELISMLKKMDSNSPRFFRGEVLKGKKHSIKNVELEKLDGDTTDIETSLVRAAQLWVGGEDIVWRYSHAKKKRKRLPLPTCPFVKQRHWIESTRKAEEPYNVVSEGRKGEILPPSGLHPLITRNTSTLQGVSFFSRLSDIAYYAKDHIVFGRRLFPGAGFLEIVCIAANLAGRKKVTGLRHVAWSNSLSFDVGSRAVQTVLTQNDQSKTLFEVLPAENLENDLRYVEGEVLYETCKNKCEKIAFKECISQCDSTLPKDILYQNFRALGYEYGSDFQVIRTLHVADNTAVAELVLPDDLYEDFHQYILHPSLLDGAMQTVIGMMQQKLKDASFVPFSLQELTIHRPLLPHCFAVVNRDNSLVNLPNQVKKFSIDIVSIKGEPLVSIHNMCALSIENRERLDGHNVDKKYALDSELSNAHLRLECSQILFDI